MAITNAITLLYHDVVPEGQFSSSGFPTGAASLYKLSTADFQAHLDAVSEALSAPVLTASQLDGYQGRGVPVLFTFDDGGVSALEIGRMLAARGWPGHFFVTTDYIGSPGFLAESQIRELHAMGHVIGSHSCSHPPRISHLGSEAIAREWSESVRVLEGILGEPVTTASVPAGFYSPEVARLAAVAGVRYLFCSDPTTRIVDAGGCRVLGRYSAKRYSPPAWATARVRQERFTLLRESAVWGAKKLAKALGGEPLLAMRRRILRPFQ